MSDPFQQGDGFPKDWDTILLGDAFDLQLGKMLSKASKVGWNPKPYLANRNVQWDKVDVTDLETMDFSGAEQEKFALRSGDLLVCEGGEVGRASLWHGEVGECYYQKAIHRLRPKTSRGIIPQYLLRYMRLASVNGWFTNFTSQTSIAHLTREKLAQFPVCVPSPAEQRKIAKILTAIDNLIEKTEALIAKYQSVKQGLMHDLFTRGVDEHGHLRPPDAEAPDLYKETELGWIPKEWSIPTVGRVLARLPKNGYSPKESDEWTGTIMLGLGCLTPTGFQPVQLKNAPANDPKLADALLSEGDLLISRSNTHDLVALVGRYRDIGVPCVYPDLMMRLVPTESVLPEFLEAVLGYGPVRRQLTSASCGTSGSMMKINSGMVVNTIMTLPSKHEQQRILHRMASVRRIIAHSHQELDKLKQAKTALMQDLLTGKVRVKVDKEPAAHV